MPEADHVRLEVVRDVLVATVLDPSVTDYEANIAQAEILAAAPEHDWRVVIDLGPVELLASAGIGMVLAVHSASVRGKGRMVVCNLGEEITGVLKLTKLDKLFPIAKTRDDAIAKALK